MLLLDIHMCVKIEVHDMLWSNSKANHKGNKESHFNFFASHKGVKFFSFFAHHVVVVVVCLKCK